MLSAAASCRRLRRLTDAMRGAYGATLRDACHDYAVSPLLRRCCIIYAMSAFYVAADMFTCFRA